MVVKKLYLTFLTTQHLSQPYKTLNLHKADILLYKKPKRFQVAILYYNYTEWLLILKSKN